MDNNIMHKNLYKICNRIASDGDNKYGSGNCRDTKELLKTTKNRR